MVAERAFLAGLGGGCSVPVAALGRYEAGRLTLRGRVYSPDGRQMIAVAADAPAGSPQDAAALGYALAEKALDQGATALLEGIR